MSKRKALPRITSSSDPGPQQNALVRVGRPSPPPRAGRVGASPAFDARPCFASSWVKHVTLSGEVESSYFVDGVQVSIRSPRDSSLGEYIIDPPEYRLDPLELQALSDAMERVARATPVDVRFESLQMARPYIKAKAKDILYARLASDLSRGTSGRDLEADSERLAELLCKFTAGYGVLETLLKDANVQDIYVDAPSSQTPVYVVLRSNTDGRVRQKCRTNIMVGRRDLQGIVSRVKLESRLPFSEAAPVLEADLPNLAARITVVGPPISLKGVSVAIRKQSDSMWTLPDLIENGSVSPLLSSFLWACVTGRRTVLLAGSRGAGKTTLLGSMLLEFPLTQRVIVIEDTPEIPVRRLQELGYDVQALRFISSQRESTSSAQESLRVSLRMGESAIVLGEVRGREARVLYESMRAGSAGSSVLGTIHANSAQGVLDRAVEDLGVSERAFSSTDVVVVIGLVRSPDGSRFLRRVTEVAEVRERGGAVELAPLFSTEPGCPCAKPTPQFSAEARTFRGIASSLGIASEAIVEIVRTRAHADQIVSETLSRVGGTGGCGWEELRVRSNEVLAAELFSADTPEVGLDRWRDWFNGISLS